MNNIFWKSLKGNFGDDLNAYLWTHIWGDKFNNTSNNTDFIGIGSVLGSSFLSNEIRDDSLKVVFGAGYRPSNIMLQIGDNWDIVFLRGPLSAYALQQKGNFITDAAYSLSLLNEYPQLLVTPKKYELSIMPYFRSVGNLDWEKIANKLGAHYISPLAEVGVEQTLIEIAQSRFLITEAMHGAIVADVLRVPWHRFIFSTYLFEGSNVSDFKWNDWLYSLDIGNLDKTMVVKTNMLYDLLRYYIYREKKYFGITRILEDHIVDVFKTKSVSYTLSSDKVLNDVIVRLSDKSEYIRNRYMSVFDL